MILTVQKMGADCGFKLNEFDLLTLLYADDQILLSGSENPLQKALYALDKIINGYSFSVPTEKTKVIIFVINSR